MNPAIIQPNKVVRHWYVVLLTMVVVSDETASDVLPASLPPRDVGLLGLPLSGPPTARLPSLLLLGVAAEFAGVAAAVTSLMSCDPALTPNLNGLMIDSATFRIEASRSCG